MHQTPSNAILNYFKNKFEKSRKIILNNYSNEISRIFINDKKVIEEIFSFYVLKETFLTSGI